MENLQKIIVKLKRIYKEAEGLVKLGYNSTNDLPENTVAWAICNQFYSEAISIKSGIGGLVKDIESETNQLEENMKDCENELKETIKSFEQSYMDNMDNLPF